MSQFIMFFHMFSGYRSRNHNRIAGGVTAPLPLPLGPTLTPRLADKWRTWFRRPFAPPDYQHFRLGHAVAASSSVPGLFEPLVLPDLYKGKTVRLVDGGVYDNQGTAS